MHILCPQILVWEHVCEGIIIAHVVWKYENEVKLGLESPSKIVLRKMKDVMTEQIKYLPRDSRNKGCADIKITLRKVRWNCCIEVQTCFDF